MKALLLVVHAAMSFDLVLRCHQLLSEFLAKGPLPRVSWKSRLLVNDKGDNQMILGTVPRSPGMYLIEEENPGKPQLGDRLMMDVRPVIVSNGVP